MELIENSNTILHQPTYARRKQKDKIQKCRKKREREEGKKRKKELREEMKTKRERKSGKETCSCAGAAPVLICSRKLLVLRLPPTDSHPRLSPPSSCFIRSFRMHGPESSGGTTIIPAVV